MLKKHIKEVVIVEGKTDTTKLKSLFNLDTIETNGSHLSKKNIQLIKNISEQRGVILFLDPDGPGEKIRRILEQNLTKFKQAFIKKNKINPKKIGIAESDNKDIIYALSKVSTFDKNNLSFT
jgi:ribonuclease M5